MTETNGNGIEIGSPVMKLSMGRWAIKYVGGALILFMAALGANSVLAQFIAPPVVRLDAEAMSALRSIASDTGRAADSCNRASEKVDGQNAALNAAVGIIGNHIESSDKRLGALMRLFGAKE